MPAVLIVPGHPTGILSTRLQSVQPFPAVCPMPTRLLPIILLSVLCAGTSQLPAQIWPSTISGSAQTEATPRLASAELEARSMSPPDWGGKQEPVAPVASLPAGSIRSESLPGLTIGPELYPGQSPPTPKTGPGPVFSPVPAPVESPSAFFPQELEAPAPAAPSQPFGPAFDPGFRTDGYQGTALDWLENGQQFPHEAQQYHPPLSEILKTGRYFGSVEWQLLQPHWQNNTALVRSSPGSFSSEPFNWTYESAPQIRAGFESCNGPGVELDYWQFDHDSSSVIGVSDGLTGITSSLPEIAAGTFNMLSATAAGERLVTQQGLELHSAGLSFFKEMKLPVSRIAGTVGLRYLSLAQQAEAIRLDAGGNETGRLEHITDFRGFGPRIRFDYLRPIGHTKFEAIGSFGSSLLFGNRDQFVTNSLAGDFSRTNADELVTTVEAALGVQYVKHLGENRCAFVRLTYQSQTWLGAGTATDATGDLGFRGLGFSVGTNR